MEKYFVGFHLFIMNFTKLGNISRKMRKTSMCKGFEQREMLFKHIPYIKPSIHGRFKRFTGYVG